MHFLSGCRAPTAAAPCAAAMGIVSTFRFLAQNGFASSARRSSSIAAETREAPAEACERVLVHYEELPAVFDPVAVMAPGAPRVKEEGNVIAEWNISQADVAQGFAESSVVVENTYRTPFAEHANLEPEEGVVCLTKMR